MSDELPEIGSLRLERSSLSDQAYVRLRELIVTGQLQPGERIVERQLAERMGVSRTPLREALIRLEQEEVVTSVRSGGLVVAALERGDVQALYAIRIALESYATRLAAETASAQVVKELDNLVRAQQEALEPIDRQRLETLNNEFHSILYAASGIPQLSTLIDVYRLRAITHGIYDLYESSEARRAVDEHLELVEAVKHHRADLVEDLMRQHISRGATIVLQRRLPDGSPRL